MTISIVTNLFVSFGLAVQPTFASAAADARDPGIVGRLARPSVSSPSNVASATSFDARRDVIFTALRGGNGALAADVTHHLWQLAGRLAASEWSPPRMNVDVVVRNTNGTR